MSGALAFVVLDVTFDFFPRRGGTLRGAAAGTGGHIVKIFGTRFTVALYDADALSLGFFDNTSGRPRLVAEANGEPERGFDEADAVANERELLVELVKRSR